MVLLCSAGTRAVLLLVTLLLTRVVLSGRLQGTGFTVRGHEIAVVVALGLQSVTRSSRVRDRVGPGRGVIHLRCRSRADGDGREREAADPGCRTPVTH